MSKILLFVMTLVFIIIFIAAGSYGLSRDTSNVMAYAMLGLGLGGLIALVGTWLNRKSS